MKALSIRQPWAWLICAAYKDVENRAWASHFRGRIYIHTGKQLDIDNQGWYFIKEILSSLAWLHIFKTEFIQDLARGAIIGEVNVIDCVRYSRSPWFTGPFAFVLSHPVLYEEPIPCKGKLGFFEPEIP